MINKIRDIDDVIGYIAAFQEIKCDFLEFKSNDGRHWSLNFRGKHTAMKTRDVVVMLRLWFSRSMGGDISITDYDGNTFVVTC